MEGTEERKETAKMQMVIWKVCQEKTSSHPQQPSKEKTIKQDKSTRINYRMFLFPQFSFSV